MGPGRFSAEAATMSSNRLGLRRSSILCPALVSNWNMPKRSPLDSILKVEGSPMGILDRSMRRLRSVSMCRSTAARDEMLVSPRKSILSPPSFSVTTYSNSMMFMGSS